ncbi:TPA: hypothetical protein ACRB0F_003606 [Legionella anisa]|nr:hypothetical protein [Legionella anisa]MCW8423104.1 hypothetical protein [Legionella anisa]
MAISEESLTGKELLIRATISGLPKIAKIALSMVSVTDEVNAP